MKLKLFIIALSSILFLKPGFNSQVSAEEDVNANNLDTNSLIEVHVNSFSKVVTKTYPLRIYETGRLPKSIVASEIRSRQYYSGRLYLRDFYIKGQRVTATYVGKMYPTLPGNTPLQNKVIK